MSLIVALIIIVCKSVINGILMVTYIVLKIRNVSLVQKNDILYHE